jgi:alcohol dehydrogenase
MKLANMPVTLTECNVTTGILPVLADEANQQWTARFNPRPVTDDDLLALYQAAM